MIMNHDELQAHLITDHDFDPLTVTGKCFGVQSLPARSTAELTTLHNAQPHHAHDVDVAVVIIELRAVHQDLPNCFTVVRAGEDLGDIERLADGTWIGDVTQGNGPPSKPFATRDEAVAYVTTSWRS